MIRFTLLSFSWLLFLGCDDGWQSSDRQQQTQQEQLLKEGSAQTGMPAIKNFRERKMLKDILELRDQQGLTTFTYICSERGGKLRYLGETIGYGIPYATQYTNPQKITAHQYGYAILPQADPNGLFSPVSAEGTWVLMKDPNSTNSTNSTKVAPVYIEPRIVVSPFKLPTRLLED